jgi:hypothetical protein
MEMAAIAKRRTARGIGSSSASLRLRVRVWWRRRLLIEALVAGADPDDSAELTLIAGELIGKRARQQMADAIDRVVRDAASQPTPGSAAAPLNRRGIIRARAELAALAGRLRDPAPVPVHGMALAELLVRNGVSPIYDRESPHSVWRLARTVRHRLDEPIR